MANYKKSAASEVAKFVWNQIVEEGILDPHDYHVDEYDLIMPVVPVQEEPQLANYLGENPYIVYTFSAVNREYDTNWMIKSEMVTLRIYSPSYSKTVEIINMLQDKLGRFDDSATLVNKFCSPLFYFHHVRLEIVEPIEPAESEGGRYGAEAVFYYEYDRQVDSDGNWT